MDLINKYTIYKPEIGSGAYSKVYKALDKNGRTIAIKKINIHNINDKLLERIEYEIHIHKKLEHPNIVKLYDVFRNDMCICLILEYCDHDFDNIKYNIKPSEIKSYIIQLNEALKYLKENNIIHRDIKPKNILLSGNTIKLADFGFASDKTIDMYNTICGSPLYMAPEIINIFIGVSNEINNKSVYDSKCDIWSLGLIIYECYFKFHPFKNSINVVELYKNIKNNNISFIPLTYCDYDEHDKIINLLKKMLVCDVNNRISWQQYFNHTWFSINDQKNEHCSLESTSSKPISIPNKNNDNIIRSMPCFNNNDKLSQNANKYYDDIDYLLKDDYDEYYKKKNKDDELRKNYKHSSSKDKENTFIMDTDTDTDTDIDISKDIDIDIDNRTDYIIINEDDLLLFDTNEYKPPSITSGMYNFLSNSIDKLKNNIRYFTY
jgi:serine/threonine protein kinase